MTRHFGATKAELAARDRERAATTRKHCYLWLDLETTGLDPRECRILEWAVLLAADDRGGDMRPIREYTSVVSLDAKGWEEAQREMDPYVLDMHTKNGLLAECCGSDTTLAEGEDFLIALCQELTGLEEAPARGAIELAGSGVGRFDRRFIDVHMPRFAKWLKYRDLDVSSLRMAERDWAGVPIVKDEAHRALPDIRESLARAAEIRACHERWN